MFQLVVSSCFMCTYSLFFFVKSLEGNLAQNIVIEKEGHYFVKQIFRGAEA